MISLKCLHSFLGINRNNYKTTVRRYCSLVQLYSMFVFTPFAVPSCCQIQLIRCKKCR